MGVIGRLWEGGGWEGEGRLEGICKGVEGRDLAVELCVEVCQGVECALCVSCRIKTMVDILHSLQRDGGVETTSLCVQIRIQLYQLVPAYNNISHISH